MEEQNDRRWESIDLPTCVNEFKLVFNGLGHKHLHGSGLGQRRHGGTQVTTCVDDEHGEMNAEITVAEYARRRG